MTFETKRLPVRHDAVAPDGSLVRVLLARRGGSLAHFELGAGQTSIAVVHRTVDEIWYVLAGRGEMWRRADALEEIVPLERGVSLTIPLGTHFQFRSFGPGPLEAVAVTMPPWPGEGEAREIAGAWAPTVRRLSARSEIRCGGDRRAGSASIPRETRSGSAPPSRRRRGRRRA